MPRLAVAAVIVALAAAITWRYPLFHIVSLKKTTDAAQSSAFDAGKFAARFWENDLPAVAANAPDAAEVFALLLNDADKAREQFGRRVGISRSTLFTAQGRGKVTAVEDGRVGVQLDSARPGTRAEPDLWLTLDPVFNNAVRDSSGIIRAKDFPNSQDFNQLAAALNALVENRVVAPLRESAAVGKSIRFAACVEVRGGAVKLPLTLIPLEAVIE
jgi:predicted lipoprotein